MKNYPGYIGNASGFPSQSRSTAFRYTYWVSNPNQVSRCCYGGQEDNRHYQEQFKQLRYLKGR